MAASDSFLTRNGDKVLLILAIIAGSYLTFTKIEGCSSTYVPDKQEKLREGIDEATRRVTKSWTTEFKAPEPVDLDAVLLGGTYTYADSYDMEESNILKAPPVKLLGPLNGVKLLHDPPHGSDEYRLRIRQQFTSNRPDTKHPQRHLIRYEVQRAVVADPQAAAPREEDFETVQDDIEPDKPVFRDTNKGQGLLDKRKYFYRARAVATYKLGTAAEETLHVTGWSNLLAFVVKNQIDLVYQRPGLGGIVIVIMRKRVVVDEKGGVVRRIERVDWRGKVGEILGVFKRTPRKRQTEAVKAQFETSYILRDRVEGTVKAYFTDRVIRLVVDVSSHELLNNGEEGPMEFDPEAQSITVELAEKDGQPINNIVAEAFNLASDKHKEYNGRAYPPNGQIKTVIKKVAAPMEPKFTNVISASGVPVKISGCPLHGLAMHMEIEPLEGVAPGGRDWVAYYCPVAKKYFIADHLTQVQSNPIVTGPYEPAKPVPAARGDLAAALAQDAKNKEGIIVAAEMIPDPGLEFGNLLRKLKVQTRKIDVDFIIVETEDGELIERVQGAGVKGAE